MKIKKFHAPSMNQAMEQIRMELGKDAVILNSKVMYSGGFFGFFKKRSIEVIAAVDPQAQVEQQPILKDKRKMVDSVIKDTSSQQEKNDFIHRTEEIGTAAIKQDRLLEEMADLKKIVKTMNLASTSSSLSGNIKKLIGYLEGQELNKEVVTDITLLLEESMDENEISYEDCVQLTKRYLQSKLPKDAAPVFNKKYINVLGPTGVGKTTTLAKLAAESVLKHQKKVAFITTDTYRIAAIDQLKTYAKILNVPIEIAYNVEDFQRAIERFSHYDLVFIDTAGRNFRNAQYVSDLQKIISFDDEMETYLVLSLTSKQSDMEAIIKQFSLIKIAHFIFTKVDETASYGAMFNLMTTYDIDTAYVTNGQNVPDDIIKVNANNIVDTILGESCNERSS